MSSLLITPRRTTGLESLKDICLKVLIDNRDSLGDVGNVDGGLLKQILVHCTAEKLARIEDTTWELSSRDLSWDTWEIWLKLYKEKFGCLTPSTKVPKLPLPGGLNEENRFREMVAKGAGNYRKLYQQKMVEMETKRKETAARAKGIMEKQKLEKESRKVQILSGPVPHRGKSPLKSRTADSKRGALMKQLGLSGGSGSKRKASQSWGISNGKKPRF